MLKLTIAEQQFIHDSKVYLERGQTSIKIDINKYNLSELSIACKEQLGTDVWFNVYSVPFSGRYCKLETDFSKRYISNFYSNEFKVIVPQPFEIVYDSNILKVSQDEQIKIHNEAVKWYKENIQNPTKPILTFWQKIKKMFA
jgi:tRNA(His) 5'-end guanylyltransferase